MPQYHNTVLSKSSILQLGLGSRIVRPGLGSTQYLVGRCCSKALGAVYMMYMHPPHSVQQHRACVTTPSPTRIFARLDPGL